MVICGNLLLHQIWDFTIIWSLSIISYNIQQYFPFCKNMMVYKIFVSSKISKNSKFVKLFQENIISFISCVHIHYKKTVWLEENIGMLLKQPKLSSHKSNFPNKLRVNEAFTAIFPINRLFTEILHVLSLFRNCLVLLYITQCYMFLVLMLS